MSRLQVGTSVDAFQDILKDAITQPDLWPAIIVDFQMPKCDYSFFEPHEDSEEAFDIRKQRIRLNGLRVDMLRIDRYDGNPEWYPRWLEMFASYCHEVAHMFIAYLSLHYTGGLDCRSPVFSLIDFQPNPRESGFFLEQYIFGGILWRGRDTSGLGSQLMVRLIFQNLSVGVKIPLYIHTFCLSNYRHMNFGQGLNDLGGCNVGLSTLEVAIASATRPGFPRPPIPLKQLIRHLSSLIMSYPELVF